MAHRERSTDHAAEHHQPRTIRVGVIVPQSNTTNETEFHQLAPPGVTFHFARIPLHMDLDAAAHEKTLFQDLTVAAEHLATCGCDLIVFGCTSDSMKFGDEKLTTAIREVSGVDAVTTAGAITRTLQDLGVYRLAMASPYTDDSNKAEAGFLQRSGFEVVAAKGLSLNTSMDGIKKMSRVPPREVYELALSVNTDDAEALLICCTDFGTLPVIEQLEQATGKPVISSNTATYATVMKTLDFAGGHDGFGRLISAIPRQPDP